MSQHSHETSLTGLQVCRRGNERGLNGHCCIGMLQTASQKKGAYGRCVEFLRVPFALEAGLLSAAEIDSQPAAGALPSVDSELLPSAGQREQVHVPLEQ